MRFVEVLITGAGAFIWRRRLRQALAPRAPAPAGPAVPRRPRVRPGSIILPARDLAICREARRIGNGYAFECRPGMLGVRMYPEGFGAFVRGWRRTFRGGLEAGGPAAAVELGLVIGWLLGAPIWMITGVVSGDGARVAVGAFAYLLAALEVFNGLRRLGQLAPVGALFYPLFAVVRQGALR